MLVICSMRSALKKPLGVFLVMAGLNGHSHNLPLKNIFFVVPGKNHIPWDARQQIFTCQVFTEQGALLWRLEDVIFRKVAGQGVECHGHGGAPYLTLFL